MLEENNRLKASEREVRAQYQRQVSELHKELELLKGRADRMQHESQEKDGLIGSLQRKLAALDRSPAAERAPPAPFPAGGAPHPPNLVGDQYRPLAKPSVLAASAPQFIPGKQFNSAAFSHQQAAYSGAATQAMRPGGVVPAGPVGPAPPRMAPGIPGVPGAPPGAPGGPPGGPMRPPAPGAPQPPGGAPRPTRPPPAGPWRCEHCTFENRNPPIYDQHSSTYKGFCEICQGVTTVKPS